MDAGSERGSQGSTPGPSPVSRRGFIQISTSAVGGGAALLATEGLAAAAPVVGTATTSAPATQQATTPTPLSAPAYIPASELSSLPAFSLEGATVETFAGFVGTTFRLIPERGMFRHVELIEARPLPRPEVWPFRDPFVLRFRAEGPSEIPGRLYAVEHDSLGAFDMHVAPAGPRKPGEPIRLDAIFS